MIVAMLKNKDQCLVALSDEEMRDAMRGDVLLCDGRACGLPFSIAVFRDPVPALPPVEQPTAALRISDSDAIVLYGGRGVPYPRSEPEVEDGVPIPEIELCLGGLGRQMQEAVMIASAQIGMPVRVARER